MKKPFVAIVGRPNVGKSTFFNKVTGRKISIVKNTPGVTRDRIYYDVDWCGHLFTLIDTGGLEVNSNNEFSEKINKQIDIAIDIADVIIFFVDGKSGLSPDDYSVTEYLRKTNKPIIVAVNKLDNNEIELTYDFYQLGFSDLVGISSEQSKGIGDLLDEVVKYLPKNLEYDEELEKPLNIALVGKPNVGKSSLVNRLLGDERVIVHNEAGTTRDAITIPFKYNSKEYNIIDTAGVRKQKKVKEDIEYYSVVRTMAEIQKADVVLIVIDAADGISEQDIRICGYVHDEGKPSVIVVNKWDIMPSENKDPKKFEQELRDKIKFMDYMDVVFVSALTGQRLNLIMKEVETVWGEAIKRISTGLLNEILREAVLANEPPFHMGKRLKILYATQASINPPNFVVFVNDSEIVHFSYQRYLENELRKAFVFKGTPIKLTFRSRSDDL